MSKQRRLSLSVIASRSPLLELPTELVLEVLGLSLIQSKPSTLSSVSKATKSFVEHIIYRTVILDSARSVALFHKIIERRSANFLALHVKKLIISWSPIPHSASARQIWDIVGACSSGLRSLALPNGFHPQSIAAVISSHEGLYELTIESYDEVDRLGRCASLHYLPAAFNGGSNLTHLRICEPSMHWCSPAAILESFGQLPHLTHLQLARRIHANDENDIIFVEDICNLLYHRKTMRQVVVSIFPPSWSPCQSVEDSNIWALVQQAARDEPRLHVAKGEHGSWKNEWPQGIDFWAIDFSKIQ